jgi:group II intron reverse transcriptase/maturase
VRRNDGAPGIDKLTLDAVEEYGIDRFLTEIQSELCEGRYRPWPARQVLIPKPGQPGQTRPLAIASVRDRVVQAALKIVFEPIFEADFLPCSFGFRPKRSAHDALHVLDNEAQRGRRWVVETDIANCFDAIPKDQLIHAVQERVCDQSVLKLLRVVLGAGVMTADGQVRQSLTGTPQGGPLSPLLCNAYLHQLDRVWSVREHGVLVRYCDDLVVMCRSREQAEAALARLGQLLAQLGLQLKQAKTRIVRLEMGGPGFDFLGFHHRLVRSRGIRGRKGVTFLARWPSDKAMRHARDRLRVLTRSSRLLASVEAVVGDMNMFLRGWGAYFRYGHSAARFAEISNYALDVWRCSSGSDINAGVAMVCPWSPTCRRTGAGWSTCREPWSHPGQVPRPGGKDRMPAVNGVGKPCAGEPHARFDGRELETRHHRPRPPQWDNLPGNRRNIRLRDLQPARCPRASSRPSCLALPPVPAQLP